MTWIWQRYQLSSLSGRATSLTPQMDRAAGCNLYLGAAVRRCVVCQDLNANCCKAHPPSLWFYLILRSQNPQIFLVISVRWDPSVPPRNYPAMLGELDVYLGLSPYPQQTHRPREALSLWLYASLGEGWYGQRVAAFTLNVVLLSLSSRGYFSLTPRFLDFYSSVLSMGSC